jgi:hypothetical protein
MPYVYHSFLEYLHEKVRVILYKAVEVHRIVPIIPFPTEESGLSS